MSVEQMRRVYGSALHSGDRKHQTKCNAHAQNTTLGSAPKYTTAACVVCAHLSDAPPTCLGTYAFLPIAAMRAIITNTMAT